MTRGAAFDVQAVCSGFIFALAVADNALRLGQARTALVIGAEVFSRILDWQDRGTCVLFGDGAGAVVLQPTDRPGGLLSSVLGSDGSGACHLVVPSGGSREPASHATVDSRQHHMRMNAREVFH